VYELTQIEFRLLSCKVFPAVLYRCTHVLPKYLAIENMSYGIRSLVIYMYMYIRPLSSMAVYHVDRILYHSTCASHSSKFSARMSLSCNIGSPPHRPALCAFFCCSLSLFSIFMNSRMPTGTPSNKSFPSSESVASQFVSDPPPSSSILVVT
jgi:hypothetical protein